MILLVDEDGFGGVLDFRGFGGGFVQVFGSFSEDVREGQGVMTSVSKALKEKGGDLLEVFNICILEPVVFQVTKNETLEHTWLMGCVGREVDV